MRGMILLLFLLCSGCMIFLPAGIRTAIGDRILSTATGTTTGGSSDGAIVNLVNNAEPEALITGLKLYKMENYYEIRLKTTTALSRYGPALNAISPNMVAWGGKTTGKTNTDIWGYYLIAMDLNSKTSTPGVARIANETFFFDANFEANAFIRATSDSGNNMTNYLDQVSNRFEDSCIRFEVVSNKADALSDNFWNMIDPSLGARFFGIPTATEKNYFANFSYDASTGEYIFRLPYSDIAKDDIKAITAFAVQNKFWRYDFSLGYDDVWAIKPILGFNGTGATVAKPNTSGKYIKVFYISGSEGGSPPNRGTIQFNSMFYEAFSTNATATVTVMDKDLTNTGLTSLNVYIQNVTNPYPLTLYQKTNGVFTNTFSVGIAAAQIMSSTNFTLAVCYTDAQPLGIRKASATVFVVKNPWEVDGLKDAVWTTAPVIGSSTIPGWNGYRIGNLYVTNDTNFLWLWVDSVNVINWANSGMFIDIAINTNSFDSANAASPWGYCYNYSGCAVKPNLHILLRAKQSTLVNQFTVRGNTDLYTVNSATPNCAVNLSYGFEMKVPLAMLGLKSSNPLRFIVVLSGDNPSQHGALDVIPEDAANTIATNWNVSGMPNVQSTYCSNVYLVK